MHDSTRLCFEHYTQSIAHSNNLKKVIDQAFNYSPSAQQSFFERVGENADFLKNVNQIMVNAQIGERLGLGIGKPIASRTKTEDKERQTRYTGEITGDGYHAIQTNYDTNLPYKLMDSWAHLNDFKTVYSNQIAKQVARDRLMIGFNGETAAEETDPVANPLLQDVNEGWIAKVRLNQPSRIMGYDAEGNATTDHIKIGDGGDYGTLDALVFDLTASLLDPWFSTADDLIVMVGREVWVNHGLTLLANSTLPTERNALQTWFASKNVAGLPCVMPPFMPSRAVIVTSYDNLSIYHQAGTLRRTIIDNPKRDRVEEYLSENEAYVVEDFGKFAGVRNGAIQLKNEAGEWV
jgi:P2 family phage major capsid protein